jgi:hypothetical protein
MSRLTTRVDRLVRRYSDQQEGARCSLCRSWPTARILMIDVDGAESWADSAVPEACAACGWVPLVVEVVEVMDWESVSKRQVAWADRSQ